MLNDYEKQLEDAKQQYEDAKQMAMENSDVAKMLDIDTLAQLIYAQNFSMPAGYVKDSSNKSWLLEGRRGVRQHRGYLRCPAAPCGRLWRCPPV